MSTSDHVVVQPDPKRMIEGLRDTGYNFETAMADILDNSVAANADKISVSVDQDFRGDIVVIIADNGCGMNEGQLLRAMKYGADERENPASLGKYGLGMKTASTAFCRSLSVLSRDSANSNAVMATWDLDHVAKNNSWDLLLNREPSQEKLGYLDKAAPSASGTVVIWEKVDRLMKSYQSLKGVHARNALNKKVDSLKTHVAMVYQRFLDHEDTRAKNIEIVVNGEQVAAWDPFVSDYSDLVAEEVVPVQMANGIETEFTIKAYILPRNEEFPSEEIARIAKVSTSSQGIYIYRENRLIIDSTWLNLFKIETHHQLLRVEFSFDYKLDEAFHLDIKKSQIILNDDLLNWLGTQFLTAPRREANARSRKGEQKKVFEQSKDAHVNSNSNIRNREAIAGGAKIVSADPENGEVVIENAHGTFKLKLPVESSLNDGQVFIQPVNSIDNGLLFEPAIIDKYRAVKINTSHSYYHKVYIPNLAQSVTIQGMDALLWALCVAELTTVSDRTSESFKDMRYEVSRILGKLVETLPDPSE
jgi:hypothetical protein